MGDKNGVIKKDSMKYISISIALAGIFVLSFLLIIQSPTPVSSPDSLEGLKDNQKIIIRGVLTKDSPSGTNRIIYIDTGFEITCRKCLSLENYRNKNVSIVAFPEKYENKTYLYALEITLSK